jgi:hypothetical protein
MNTIARVGDHVAEGFTAADLDQIVRVRFQDMFDGSTRRRD